MIEHSIRHLYQKLLVDPVAGNLPDKVSPIQITLFSGLLGLSFIPLIYFQHTILATIVLCLSGYLDTLDGTLARIQNKTSNLGSVMDIMTDRLVEFSAVFGLYLVTPEQRATATILLLGSILLCITSFLVVGIFTPNNSEKSFYYSPGLIERAETFLFIFVMILWPATYNIAALILSGLIFVTTLIRLYQFTQYSQLFENQPKSN